MACGLNPVLAVEECSTVVVSGWDAACGVAAELTGVVVTGWLATAPAAAKGAALGRLVAAPNGWLNEDENDGDRPLDPPAGRFAGLEENGPAEYGACEPGWTGIEWCSSACRAVPPSPSCSAPMGERCS